MSDINPKPPEGITTHTPAMQPVEEIQPSMPYGRPVFGGLTQKNIADCAKPIETIAHFQSPDGVPEPVYQPEEAC